MWHREGRRLEYVEMAHERSIDLDRTHFLPTAVNQFLFAPVKGEESLAIDATDVASPEPAADEGGSAVATCLEHRRQRDDAGREMLAVFFNAMRKRIRGTEQ